MFLKSLELNGFKSFAQKTILEFPAGITAIVGPNGCGKSNLIDAIRWLLGEREAKNLRSAKAEDLIFGGTPKKPRVSIAQVSLSFNNNAGFFPVDFKEISLIRKVGRDGVSQYFLNKSEVRLKDVVDFFSRSRLGTKGLTIINQGDSDLFVRVSPEERRIMIEEVLGLKEYQLKKSEAERKLKNTSLNLEKVKAIIEEVLPRLRTLKRQTNKWAKRTEIQEELTRLENNYFSKKIGEISANREKIFPSINSLERQINEKKEELKILELELKKVEIREHGHREIKNIKNQQQELLIQRSQFEKELGRLEAKLEFLGSSSEEKMIFKNDDLIKLIGETRQILEKGLTHDFENLKKAVKELLVKIDSFLNPGKNNILNKELAGLENLKKDLEIKFSAIEEKLKKLEKEELEMTAGLEEFNKKFQKAFESVEAKKEELRSLEESKNKLLFEEEKSDLKFNDLKNQLIQIGRTIEEFKLIKAEFGEENSSDMEVERRMFKLRAELSAMGEIDEALIKEAHEVENHYNFLTVQSEDLEKAIADLKNLIRELNEKIHLEFTASFKLINEEFNKFFRLMFGGGSAKLKIKKYEPVPKNNNGESEEEVKNNNSGDGEEKELQAGVEVELGLPKKRITSLEMLSGGEKSLVSIAALFALISISPPPFLVLDEIDAALDENNSKRFSNLIKEFCKKTQFIIVTHNRSVMEAADVLYGLTMGDDGTSKVLSLKLEPVNAAV
jgi:chromosome segregation protein